MELVNAWKKVVLGNYANFSGRAGRGEFWWFVLANAIVGIVLQVLGQASGIFGVLYIVYSLALLVPNLAVGVRRLHDTDKSGWLLLVGLIPCVGFILLIVWFAAAGTAGPNKYGNAPA